MCEKSKILLSDLLLEIAKKAIKVEASGKTVNYDMNRIQTGILEKKNTLIINIDLTNLTQDLWHDK